MIYYYFAFFLDRQKHIIYAACDVYLYIYIYYIDIHCTSATPAYICVYFFLPSFVWTRFFFPSVFFVSIIYTTRDRLYYYYVLYSTPYHRRLRTPYSHVCRKTISESSRVWHISRSRVCSEAPLKRVKFVQNSRVYYTYYIYYVSFSESWVSIRTVYVIWHQCDFLTHEIGQNWPLRQTGAYCNSAPIYTCNLQ